MLAFEAAVTVENDVSEVFHSCTVPDGFWKTAALRFTSVL